MIVIVGGGPGGSMCAARFCQLGEPVVVVEKRAFPRFQLGESLLPGSLPLLDAIGVLDEVRARFIVKRGAEFHDGETGRSTRFAFDTAFDTRFGYAFQVPRDEFDALLLSHAAKLGAEVLHGWTVKRTLRDGDRVTGVEATDADGNKRMIEARFVVDATGREALFARSERATQKITGLDNTAFYTHVRGLKRPEGDREGDIHIVMFGSGEQASWFWVIPFKDGRTSVGAVVTRAWMRAFATPNATPDDMFARAVERSPTMQRLLAGTEALWPARAAADYSYSVTKSWGPGWAAIGDAGGFIDPLFSSGVHLAMSGAFEGAPAILAYLGGDAAALDTWSTRVRGGTELFLAAVRAFYAGKLQRFMFSDTPHTFLRRSITSLLSGDVFDATLYTRDMRDRLNALLRLDS